MNSVAFWPYRQEASPAKWDNKMIVRRVVSVAVMSALPFTFVASPAAADDTVPRQPEIKFAGNALVSGSEANLTVVMRCFSGADTYFFVRLQQRGPEHSAIYDNFALGGAGLCTGRWKLVNARLSNAYGPSSRPEHQLRAGDAATDIFIGNVEGSSYVSQQDTVRVRKVSRLPS